MENNCLYCERHFTSARSNKRYCSDNCKQMAYYKRNGLVLSGAVKPEIVSPAILKEENVKYDSDKETVKYEMPETPNVKCDPTIPEKTIDLSPIQELLRSFAESMERKLAESFNKMKQELIVKYDLEVEKSRNVKYGAENKIEELDHEEETSGKRHPIKMIDLYDENQEVKEADHAQLNVSKNAIAETEEEQDHQEKEQPGIVMTETDSKEGDVQKLKAEITVLKRELLEATKMESKEEFVEQIEEPYQWIESTFIKQIEKHILNENKSQQFNQRINGWNYPQLESVNWINVRLRCLIESIVKLSNLANIDTHTLHCMHDAFSRLVKSSAFKSLPENYPYMELIKELFTKVNTLFKNNSFGEKIKFQISEKLKARLIAVRYGMMKFIPATKFSEMNFIETGCLAPVKKKEEEIRKTPDWYWRYKAMKRKEERQAA